jgi:biopolymer transport protein ExbD
MADVYDILGSDIQTQKIKSISSLVLERVFILLSVLSNRKCILVKLKSDHQMRNLFFIILICVFVACGGSKKTIQNTTPDKDKTIEAKTPEATIEITESGEEKVEKPSQQQKEAAITKEHPKEDVVEILNHKLWNDLLQKHVSADGTVDYKGFKKDHITLKAYLDILSKYTLLENYSTFDKLAYWINVYNAFTVKLIIDNYPLESIRDINNPWDLRFFKLGNKWYTLNDVEHKILRKMGDPRIHFGINCASISCPPLLNRAFTTQNVDHELEKLAINFINDPKRNTITSNRIQLSKIFSWFAKDFKTEGSLIHFLNKYSRITINSNAKKSFKKYNWNLNE